jgi:hypothetical protein
LAGSYLKSLQLAKQLEERAKEATKNKELAEKEHEALQEFIEDCRDNDVDLTEVRRLVGEFEAAMASKDYQSALGHVKTASEAAKNAYIQKIGAVADSVDALFNLMQGSNAEPKAALDLLEKSKTLVVKDDLEGAMKYAKNAYDAAERLLQQHFSDLLSEAQEIIIQAKDAGDDVGLYEDLLSRAKGNLDKQEYEPAISQIKEAVDGAGDNLKTQIRSAISKAEELVAAGEELGADMSRVKGNVEKANGALEGLRFKDAFAYSKRADTDGENTISAKFQELVRETRDGIKKVKSVEEDVSVPQQLLDQAQTAMKEKKYIEALHTISLAREKTQAIQFQSVLEVMSKARDRFVLAKKVGVDMAKAIMLLNTSRDNLKLGKFEDAVSYAEQSQKEIDTALEIFYKARDQLVELSKAIRLAGDLGIDVEPLKENLTEAKRLFEAREYAQASDRIKKELGQAKKVVYDRTMETIDLSDKGAKLGKEMGADMTEAEGVLNRALEAMSKEDVIESMSLAKASLDAGNAAMTRLLSDRFQNLEQFINGFVGDADLTEVNDIISNGRAHIASLEFDKSFALLKEATQKIEKSGQEECERQIRIATEKMSVLASMSGDVSDLGILLNRANEALAQKVYDDATARAKVVINNADEQMLKLVHAEFSSIKDALEEAKSIGIETDEARIAIRDAMAKADSHDYPEAYRIISNTKTGLKDRISKYDGVKEKIHKSEELLAEAAKSRADVGPMMRRLDSAKNAFASGDMIDADRMLDNLLAETEKNLAMYLAAKFILTSKENIELAQLHGIQTEPVQTLMSQAKELMKKKNYEGALAAAKACDEGVRKTISSSIADMVKDLQRLLTDAKNVGVDTLGPEKLTERAAELARNGDYLEALKCIESARDDIDHVKNLSSQAAVEIRVARGNLKDAEMLDLEAGQSRELLEQSIEALTRHQYAIALELARKSSEASVETSKTRIWDTLGKFKDRIETAASEGAPTGMAERCVADGLQAFRDGRYQDALKLAMKCEAEMERAELQREISSKAVDMAQRKMEEARAEGIESERLRALVQKSKKLFAEGKFSEALSAAIDSGDELQNLMEGVDSARIEMSAVREQIERLKKVNIDTAACDEMLDMAQEFISSHDFLKSREALRRCSAKAVSLFEGSVSEVMDSNRRTIARAKQMGIDTKPCEDLMEVAKTSFSEKLWDFAYQQAEAARRTCFELMSKKMSNLIDDIRGRAQVMGRMGAATRPIEDMIDEAVKADEEGDSALAFQTLMSADQKILAIEDAHKKYLDISLAAESAIETLNRFGISTKEAERLLALADIEKEKDYDSAIEFVAEALDTAKTMMESYSADIAGSISAPGLQAETEGEIKLVLRNAGRALAKDLSIDLAGEFSVVSVSQLSILRPGTEETVTARIIPKNDGDVTIRATISTKRHMDGRKQSFDIEDVVRVFKAGPPFKIDRATGPAKCAACQGRIKPGFDIVICKCGNQTHLTCAKRIGQCPVCGQKYSF